MCKNVIHCQKEKEKRSREKKEHTRTNIFCCHADCKTPLKVPQPNTMVLGKNQFFS